MKQAEYTSDATPRKRKVTNNPHNTIKTTQPRGFVQDVKTILSQTANVVCETDLRRKPKKTPDRKREIIMKIPAIPEWKGEVIMNISLVPERKGIRLPPLPLCGEKHAVNVYPFLYKNNFIKKTTSLEFRQKCRLSLKIMDGFQTRFLLIIVAGQFVIVIIKANLPPLTTSQLAS